MNNTSVSLVFPSTARPWQKNYSPEAVRAGIPERTLYQYIYDANKDYPEDVVYHYFGTAITFGELFEKIRRTAGALKAAGVKAGDMVTIQSMQTPETIVVYYALSYLGAVANMVYMTLTPNEILQTVRDTGSRMFFILDKAVQAALAADLPEDVTVVTLPVSGSMPEPLRTGYLMQNPVPENPYPTYEEFLSSFAGADAGQPASDAHAPSVIVYTSGTTGEPKGVVLSGHNVNAMAFQYIHSEMQFRRGETYLDILPLFLSYGVGMLQLAASVGIDSTLWISLDPAAIAVEFNRLKPNHFAGAPTMVDEIMKQTTGDLSGMINFTGGGEALSPEKDEELNRFLKEHNAPEEVKYACGYGMSEVASSACANNNKLYKKGSLGLPLPLTNVKIVDEDTGEELPLGQTGEICFNTPSIMLGYYKNEEATREIIEIDEEGRKWVHTGDLGSMDEDGFLFYRGKIKRIYLVVSPTTGSMKLFPKRLEDLLESDAAVDRCAVVASPDPERGYVPEIFITRSQDSGEDSSDLIARICELIAKELPDHYEPKAIRILDVLPRTASGKVDYQELERQASLS